MILSHLTFYFELNHLLATARPAFALVSRLLTKYLLCPNLSGTTSKRKILQTETFRNLSTSLKTFDLVMALPPSAQSTNKLKLPPCFVLWVAPSSLTEELKSKSVILTTAPSASDRGLPGFRTWSSLLHLVCVLHHQTFTFWCPCLPVC